MRTLYEILEAVKDGQKPSYDECYWSMLALSALHTFDAQDILRVFEKSGGDKRPFGIGYVAEQNFQRNKIAYQQPPKKYVGWGNDPANPAYQKFRQAAKRIAESVLAEDENSKE